MKKYGLIFDVDGVIADSETVNAHVSSRVFSELFGVDGVERDDFAAGLGRGAEAFILAAASVHGVQMSESDLERAVEARERWFYEFLESNELPALPGVLGLLFAAETHHEWSVAIATSSVRKKSQAVLSAAGVPFERFTYVTGDEVQNKKPAPDVFEAATRGLSIDPSRCVVIEDSPDGVRAAHAAGCRCVAVTNSVAADRLAHAELVVDSLVEVTIARLRDVIEQRGE